MSPNYARRLDLFELATVSEARCDSWVESSMLVARALHVDIHTDMGTDDLHTWRACLLPVPVGDDDRTDMREDKCVLSHVDYAKEKSRNPRSRGP
jgi:hypothetical protein